MEGRCFGRVSHSGHVWGGEGSPERTKRSERAKSTRFPPVKEEIATLVVNKTAAPPQLCGRPRDSRLGHQLPLERGPVCLSICVFHLELWLLPRVLKTDRSCLVSYCCVLKNVKESPRVSRQRAPVSSAVKDLPGERHFITGVLKRFPLHGRSLCTQGFSSLRMRGSWSLIPQGLRPRSSGLGRVGGWREQPSGSLSCAGCPWGAPGLAGLPPRQMV